MFAQTFVEFGKTRKPYSMLASVIAQLAVISILVVLPLIYMQEVPAAQLRRLLFAPPKPPTAVKTSKQDVHPKTQAVRMFKFGTLGAPTVIPKIIGQPMPTAPPPEIAGSSLAEGTNALPAGVDGAVGSQAPMPPPLQEKKLKGTNQPVRIGGVVAEANLIQRIQPVYPPLARAARVSGAVRFAAVISKDGKIENLQLISGHPLLVNAAREAILQWRYRPTLLNGQPVSVITEITVQFTLAS